MTSFCVGVDALGKKDVFPCTGSWLDGQLGLKNLGEFECEVGATGDDRVELLVFEGRLNWCTGGYRLFVRLDDTQPDDNISIVILLSIKSQNVLGLKFSFVKKKTEVS